MRYNLFIDESGDHGLSNLNPNFPVFVLCGIVISEEEYEKVRIGFNNIKKDIWNNENVIFHSRDIRKCEKEFKYLFDLNLKNQFYHQLDNIIETANYNIIASAIKKEKYIKLYGKLSDDVYEISLSFIIERAIFYLDSLKQDNLSLTINIEKRGLKEDKKLTEHFQRLLARGTGYISAERMSKYHLSIHFKSKKENINGLQLADLVAYPIARHVLEPERINPAYAIFKAKFYTASGKRYGLKIFP
ncbi:MAG: DUF3800 domain-containing protein [Sphingobacteriales bacterium]|jgi:hypothetical protein|nr:MAG: DUF3800 domain-containing protein [Sphingobacteriales bacterium]